MFLCGFDKLLDGYVGSWIDHFEPANTKYCLYQILAYVVPVSFYRADYTYRLHGFPFLHYFGPKMFHACVHCAGDQMQVRHEDVSLFVLVTALLFLSQARLRFHFMGSTPSFIAYSASSSARL